MFFQFLFLYLCGSQECPSEKHKDDFKVPVRDIEVAGSNPVYPIKAFKLCLNAFFFLFIFWIRNVVSAENLRKPGASFPKRRQDAVGSERRRAGERQQEVAERKPNPVYPRNLTFHKIALIFILWQKKEILHRL